MIKRIFLIFMSLSFVLTMVSFADAAENEAVSDGSNLKFAKAMNIIDDGFNGDDAVTRIELAKLIARILVGDSEPAYDGENVFTDVNSKDAPYVMTAYDAGILNGVGGGLFNPDGNVTYIQFIKSMIVLLGRNEVALAKGGYPIGYYAAAQELGLNKNTPPDMSYDITYDGVASVLKLMQNCNIMVFMDNGSPIYTNKSYLEHYMGICFYTGIINGIDGVTSDEHSVSVGSLRVGSKAFTLAENLIDVNYLLGYRADVYYKNYGDTQDKVFYIDEFDNSVIKVDSEDLSYASDSEIKYYKENKEEKLRINPSITRFIYNNKLVGSYTVSDLNPFTAGHLDGSVIFIDNNDDGIFDIIRMKAYKTYVVDRVENGVIYNKYHKDVIIDTDELDENAVVNVAMQAISPDLIEEGDLISVMSDISGNVRTVIVTIDTYEGTIKSIENDGSRIQRIKIDDIWFNAAYSLMDSPNISKIEIGNKIKVYLNPECRISDVNTEDYEGKRIAYLIDAAQYGTMDKVFNIKLLTSGGEVTIYDLADKVNLMLGNGTEETRESKDVLTWLDTSAGRYVRQPVIYTLDSQNKINFLRRYNGTDSSNDGFYQYPDFDGDTSKTNVDDYYFRYGANSFGGKLLINDTTVMFSVPVEANRDMDEFYSVTSTSHFVDSGKITEPMWAYGTKGNNPVAEIMIVNNNATYTDIARTGEIFVVSAISHIYEDGNEYIQLSGYEKGKETLYKADVSSQISVKTGDIIRIKSDSKGIVKSIDKVFSLEDKELLISKFNPDGSNPGGSNADGSNNDKINAPNRYIYGKAYYADDYAITVNIDTDYDASTDNAVYESYPIKKFYIVNVDTSGREIKVTQGTSNNILNALDHTITKASSVFIHTRGLDCKTLVIYN